MRVHRLTTGCLIAALLCLLSIFPAAAEAAPMPGPNPAWKLSAAPPVSAGGAVLMDWTTGRILYGRNAFQPRDPASTTKILTALIALEKGRLDDKVTVSKRAAYTPGSSMYIKPGEVYSLHDLLHGLLLRSGNDAAAAIAEHVAGSVENFAVLMNARSKQLGTTVSRWVNPHGLTAAGHVSSAYDLALIAREALKNPTFQKIVSTRETPLKFEYLQRDVVLHNTNRLLSGFPGADGVKTGTTAAAGACLVASATREQHKLIAVVLHAGNRWRDSGELLNWGFANFRLATLGAAGEVVVEAPVRGGRQLAVPLALADQMSSVVPRTGADVPKLELQVESGLTAPIKKGQALGRAHVHEDGKLLGETLLVAAADVPEATLLDYLMRLLSPLVRWGHEAGAF
ncbi:MAG TPA: D-alanyl-D-alanine carboxypeptidase family protein [Symbiobacteriaceae bacterium]|nr:D-alanyl-D-alanine carboxypeptidase family protein [Symbiobacteriaceae bacterium]